MGSTTSGAGFSNLSAAQEAGAWWSSPHEGRVGTSRKGDAIVSVRFDEIPAHGAGHPQGIPEIRPWREVGWIFKDGDAVAIERQGDRTRVRPASVTHLRDE